MERFGLISEIKVSDPETWKDRVFLTFDIDWAHDEVLEDTLNLVSDYNVKATFFATHKTSVNLKIISNPNFELGIHPNFNLEFNGFN